MFNLSFDENEIKRIIREAVREEVAAQVAAQLSCIGGSVPQYANNNKPYIRGIQGLADFLGVGKSTAQKLKNMGLIPFSQQPWSKIVLFDKEKVKDALQNNSELKKIYSRSKRSK